MTDRNLKQYEGLIRSTAMKYAARIVRNSPSEFDDVLNEARIAAWKAVAQYQTGGKAKIETYIFQSVKNKMIDLERHSKRLKYSMIEANEHIEDICEVSYDLDHLVQMKQVLSQDEFELVTSIRAGGGVRAFIRELCRTTGMKNSAVKEEVSECLLRIQRKLTSSEPSQTSLTLMKPLKEQSVAISQ